MYTSLAPGRFWQRHAAACMGLAGLLVGLACWTYYYSSGFTTAHYDAKAHLVVARRIIDSQLPGYEQIGAHWLPLIHLLYLPFVAFDSQYRSGLLPSLISVLALAVSVWAVFRISLRATGSMPAAAFGGLILLANPNIEYLQSAPLTEPVYMMLNLLCLDGMMRWRERQTGQIPWIPAMWCALGALCRYEGWYFLGGLMLVLLADAVRDRSRAALTTAGVFLAVSVVPLALHFGYTYARLGDSFLHFVARGNVAPYETYRRPFLSLAYHAGELAQAASLLPLIAGLAGTFLCMRKRSDGSQRILLLLLWLPSLVNISALYWGLIYRVRYSVLLLPALSVFASFLVASAGAVRRFLTVGVLMVICLPWVSWMFPHEWSYHFLYPGPGAVVLPLMAAVVWMWGRAAHRYTLSLAILLVLGMQIPVLEGETRAVLQEAREHDYIEPQRREVLAYLRSHYDGLPILVDMSRLAPMVYDSSLPVKQFVYNEGASGSWRQAALAPHEVVGWILAEEGDEIWNRLQIDPRWAGRYALAVRTADIVLYRLRLDESPAWPSAKPSP
jgi:hypothetical protein